MSNFFVYKEISSPKNAAILNYKISKIINTTGLQIRVHTKKLFFLFLNQNICGGYSKEPSQ